MRAHNSRVDERIKKGTPSAPYADEQNPLLKKIKAKSTIQTENAKDLPLQKIAEHVAQYAVFTLGLPEQHRERVATSQFPVTHPQVLKEGTQENFAFKAAMAAIKRKPDITSNQDEVRKKILARLLKKFPPKD
jgi:hypothetical protein